MILTVVALTGCAGPTVVLGEITVGGGGTSMSPRVGGASFALSGGGTIVGTDACLYKLSVTNDGATAVAFAPPSFSGPSFTPATLSAVTTATADAVGTPIMLMGANWPGDKNKLALAAGESSTVVIAYPCGTVYTRTDYFRIAALTAPNDKKEPLLRIRMSDFRDLKPLDPLD